MKTSFWALSFLKLQAAPQKLQTITLTVATHSLNIMAVEIFPRSDNKIQESAQNLLEILSEHRGLQK